MPGKKSAESIIHIAIWVSLYLVAIIFFRTIGPFSKIDNTLILPVTIGTLFNIFIFYTVSHYLIPRFALQNRVKQFLIWMGILLLAATLMETLIDYGFLKYLYSTEDEPFIGQFVTNSMIHFIFASIALGYGFTRNWLVTEKKRQTLLSEKLSAELNFLKTQINPHFLFNVLNMAYSSATQSKDERTADIIEKLSGLMRYMIYESNVPEVEIEREIEYIRNYIRLQKMRLSDDIPVTINFNVNGNPAGLRIAPLILISFIENAFKYGVKLDKQSEIDISLNFLNGEMEFRASNQVFKGVNSMGEKNSGIGIKNTKKRLALLYPGKHTLTIENNENEFSVSLLMKLT